MSLSARSSQRWVSGSRLCPVASACARKTALMPPALAPERISTITRSDSPGSARWCATAAPDASMPDGSAVSGAALPGHGGAARAQEMPEFLGNPMHVDRQADAAGGNKGQSQFFLPHRRSMAGFAHARQ
jgi:hypothetical protein